MKEQESDDHRGYMQIEIAAWQHPCVEHCEPKSCRKKQQCSLALRPDGESAKMLEETNADDDTQQKGWDDDDRKKGSEAPSLDTSPRKHLKDEHCYNRGNKQPNRHSSDPRGGYA
ncbi:MAG: hypothetical protein JRH20_14540 [Deltaproteobacteria bacterium]|nr:hypothetical protein [Deltaproteobacteria bacterium]